MWNFCKGLSKVKSGIIENKTYYGTLVREVKACLQALMKSRVILTLLSLTLKFGMCLKISIFSYRGLLKKKLDRHILIFKEWEQIHNKALSWISFFQRNKMSTAKKTFLFSFHYSVVTKQCGCADNSRFWEKYFYSCAKYFRENWLCVFKNIFKGKTYCKVF